jgi:hypothetical protein
MAFAELPGRRSGDQEALSFLFATFSGVGDLDAGILEKLRDHNSGLFGARDLKLQ